MLCMSSDCLHHVQSHGLSLQDSESDSDDVVITRATKRPRTAAKQRPVATLMYNEVR